MAEIHARGPASQRDSSPSARLSDATTWRSLATSEDAAEAFNAWLSLFCAQVDITLAGLIQGVESVVREGMVAVGEPDSDRFSRVAAYGQASTDSLPLAKAAERAMVARRGIVQVGEALGSASQVAYPILVEGRLRGVIALELAHDAREQLELVMRLTQWGSAWFNWKFLRVQAPAGIATDSDATALQLEAIQLLATAQTTAAGAEAAATLLADRLGADKFSIGLRKGHSSRLLAMSHGGFAKVVNDYLAALLAAMDEAVDAGTRISSPHPATDSATPHAAHDRLCRVHDCDWVESVPVTLTWARRPANLVFVIEGKGPRPLALEQQLASVTTAIAPILLARLRADQSFVSRAWELGAIKMGSAIKAKPGKALLLAAATAGIVFLTFADGDYRIAADATLEGVVRRSVVAPFDGYIADAKVRPGDKVLAGAELGRLDDRDLRLQKLDLDSKLLEVTRQIDEAMGKRDIARVNILSARAEQHQADLTVTNENLTRTILTAPFAAYVVSGDKTQSIGAPVRRGDVLYEVAPLEAFRIDLDIPQGDFAAVQIGQEGRLLLSSMPYKTFPLKVVRVTPIAIARDGKTVFRAEAALEEFDPVIRPGMQGVARIDVGPRRLVWIWTHVAVDWARIKLWEWLP